MKPKILILCTGNSCRSQMAEGILRAAAGDILEIHSAGSNPAGFVHPLAVAVLGEIGIDISGHKSKSVQKFLAVPFDTVITVCARADRVCPVFPGKAEKFHWPFYDPANARGSHNHILSEFRRARDKIRDRFEAYAAERRHLLEKISAA